MPSISITYARCGHTDIVNLSGRDRHDKAAYFAKHYLCRACSRRLAGQEQSSRVAEAVAKNGGPAELPSLTGTVRQIDWAAKLRAERILEVDRCVADYEPNDQIIVREIIAKMLTERTESAWWIDHRSLSGDDVIAMLDVV